MTLKQIFDEIESHKFTALLNVASDLRTFLKITNSENCVRELLNKLDNTNARHRLIERVNILVNEKIDHRYLNPNDTALAIYIWAMSQKNLNSSKVTAEISVDAPNCWWSDKISGLVLYNYITQSVNVGDNFQERSDISVQNNNSGENIFSGISYSNLYRVLNLKKNSLSDKSFELEEDYKILKDIKISLTNTQSNYSIHEFKGVSW